MKVLGRSSLCLFLLTSAAMLAGQPGETDRLDWLQFRGPDRRGHSPSEQVFDFSDGSKLKILWKKKVSTGGYSQMIIVGSQAYTMLSDGTHDYAVGLDAASGEETWRFRIGKTLNLPNADPGPLSTPTADENVAYFLGADGRFVALNVRDGSVLWQVHLIEDLAGVRPRFGYTTSPVLAGDRVLIQVGGPKKSIVALDKSSGKPEWEVHAEPGEYSNGNYASPVVVEVAGVSQVLFKTKNYLASARTGEGTLLWRHELAENPFATPMLLPGNRVFVAGMNEGTLLKIANRKPSLLWKSASLKGNFAEPVYVDSYFYGYSGNFIVCVDAKSGEEMWKSREPGDSSLMYADGHLVVLTSKGKLVIVEANPDRYKEVDSLQVLEGRSITQPAVAQNRIFVRNLQEIACVTGGK